MKALILVCCIAAIKVHAENDGWAWKDDQHRGERRIDDKRCVTLLWNSNYLDTREIKKYPFLFKLQLRMFQHGIFVVLLVFSINNAFINALID